MTSQQTTLEGRSGFLGPVLAALMGVTLLAAWHWPAWVFMWVMAFAIYAGFKWLTYRDALVQGLATSARIRLIYLLCWPGMSFKEFAGAPHAMERRSTVLRWLAPTAKTFAGAGLVWFVVPAISADAWLLRGWVGMVGIIMMLHFGTFHLLALALQAANLNARTNMQAPLLARSLADFWGRRWNTAFNVLADRYGLYPTSPCSSRSSPPISSSSSTRKPIVLRRKTPSIQLTT